jgi:cell division protease FtsH
MGRFAHVRPWVPPHADSTMSETTTQASPSAAPPVSGGGKRSWPTWRRWLIALVLFSANYVLVSLLLPAPATQRVAIPYTLFKQQVEAANVSVITASADQIQGTFKQPVSYTAPNSTQTVQVTAFSTVQPTFADPGLETLLEQQGVVVNATSLDQTTPWWLNLLLSFGPTVLLIGGFIWLSNRAAQASGGGLFGIGRSRAKRYAEAPGQSQRITFNDVAGIDEAKAELVEIVDFLRDPKKYTRLGGAVPKGVLLVGLPGTGKTLLARAVAGEAKAPFFSMGASEFVEMVVGVGAARVRDLFKQAREASPSIIFIDELDAIGRARGGPASFSGNSEQEQTLNQILTEMDGFSSGEAVIVLAATNRPDVLDAALLRPGRFDRRVIVQPPDKIGRTAILKVHTRAVPLAADADLAQVASATPGLVGADLKNVVNEAALLAARRSEDAVHQKDFMDALDRIVLGPARPIVLSPVERERVAYHESGHAILGLILPGADPVNRVTITPHGQALGVTYQRPEDDRHNYDEAYLRARLVGAMGGRAAEEIVYGTRTTGAENDMQQATSLARQMVTRWGMSERLGPVTLAQRGDSSLDPLGAETNAGGVWRPYSDGTALLIDAEVRRMLDESYAEATRLLGQRRSELDALAKALLEHETLEEQEILQVTRMHPRPHARDALVPLAAFVATN